jgi:hypothetical protein
VVWTVLYARNNHQNESKVLNSGMNTKVKAIERMWVAFNFKWDNLINFYNQ